MIDLSIAVAEARSAGTSFRHAIADNIAFEERLSVERRDAYQSAFPDMTEWDLHHARHVRERIEVTGAHLPETFDPINAPMFADGLDDRQTVVRLERVDWPLSEAGLTITELEKWLSIERDAKRRPDDQEKIFAREGLKDFFDVWNEKRDDRPLFVAFKDEVAEDLAAPDWPRRLRDRLGLGHYHVPEGAAAVNVALMEYQVRDVSGKNDGATFARPTALDGGLNPYFFPAPGNLPCGRTLDLAGGGEDRLAAEILHRRVDYKLEWLRRLGVISTPIPKISLKRRRNDHLTVLRGACGRADFGQAIPDHVVD